ncbi:uncharacterized protein Z519_04048 [Cladophialophora bantiana CBS 173.52]|uniref:C2H2-type domain-containing protein n=1 Tax=Cladophialophora bantiana (strain ATCC 10958 / CBS 173.52 / CDC B-1940 / NIH 8579) TaxID=1442370 RepID=A0A0D2HPV3_CLAB1|nr:uncharacterized protein Z519_04048 [Cladophialophora bantiana CBS 173.52]KIW95463.1 hypothetical protein Z519_04048 [Cladophialophora bantiana CBS 173.52]
MQEYIPDGSPRFQRLNALLTYMPDYGLVICKRCEFAIQPQAISSHLLRHRIYRGERQELLERIGRLKLLDPAEVPKPPPDISPLPYLQVSDGYRCKFPACDHLYISEKRMSQHLHGSHKELSAINIEIQARRVRLQTFFKGNKIRYFEVNAAHGASNHKGPTDSTTHPLPRLSRLSHAQVAPTSPADDDSRNSGKSSAAELPMSDLMYLHHYITRTSLSLTRGDDSLTFWADTLPLHASTQPFLMHGILGVAAFHQAAITSDAQQRKMHQSNGLLHQSAGLFTFRELVKQPTAETSTSLAAFARLLGVQFCAQALLDAEDQPAADEKPHKPKLSQILDFMLLLRGGCDLLVNMKGSFSEASGFAIPSEVLQGLGPLEIVSDADGSFLPYAINQLNALLRIKGSALKTTSINITSIDDIRHLAELCREASVLAPAQPITEAWVRSNLPSDTRLSSHIEDIAKTLPIALADARLSSRRDRMLLTPRPVIKCYPYIPPAIYSHLASLPGRIISAGPTPDSAELEMFDQGMAALVSSYSRSYAANTTWAQWNGIESWPRLLPDEFLRLIEAGNSIALVLVAYWCVLVSKQEQFYWFLNGQSQRMLNVILANLDPDMQSFVQENLSHLSQA